MTDDTRVLYNAACPVCNFEISHYAKYSRESGLAIRFEDLNAEVHADWGLTPDQAARRLYVLKNGQIFSGIPAFLQLWQDMPRYRWLANIVSVPGLRHLAVLVYDWMLAPAIYQWHRARLRRKRIGDETRMDS